ncbi:hypothetical protein BD289DRAFT_482615 [Coniella lustricola]|uniref:Uncharacterized protein n=1 Tax=Coniella lustricola TaxID=2025994 RepID=A0A2T3A870_9PEZI|nr:hypothetical protein BD289DRAFT_482615 [Coniella lustricola]
MAEIPIYNMNDINDVEDVEEIDDVAAMAAAMGFSGFGMQPAAKKRKFNPNADASVAGLPNKPSNNAGRDSSTGANSAPLGQRRLPLPPANLHSRPHNGVKTPPRGRDADGIYLDHDEDCLVHDDNDGIGGTGIAVGGGAIGANHADPTHLVASQSMDKQHSRTDNNINLDAQATGPATPYQRTQIEPRNQQQHQRRGRGGAHADNGKPWWEDYVDVRMNENPWARLEQQRGLEARGTWPPPILTASTKPNAGILKTIGTETDAATDIPTTDGQEEASNLNVPDEC